MKLVLKKGSPRLILFVVFGLLISQASIAQFIKCAGDLAFWYEEKSSTGQFSRKLYGINQPVFFKPASRIKNRLGVGSVWTKPEVEITPFIQVSADIRADKQDVYKFSTDGRSWFILSKGRQKLECDVAETEYF